MPSPRSAAWNRAVNATSGKETPLTLLEIDHPLFPAPVRVVSDNQDLVSNGELYIASRIRCWLPGDREGQMPRAKLAIDNTDKAIGELLEDSAGAEGATVRIMEVLRSTPDVIEREETLDFKNIEIANMEVTADIGYEDILNRPAVQLTYRPDVAPGLF